MILPAKSKTQLFLFVDFIVSKGRNYKKKSEFYIFLVLALDKIIKSVIFAM